MASTISRPAVRHASLPRIHTAPDYGSSAGQEAIELAAMAGLILDDWQQLVMRDALGEAPGGKWAAFQVGILVPRQNGKGGILEARELAGLFLFNDRLIIHSAHLFDTSIEAFLRMEALIEETPEFSRRVKTISRSHGHEGIVLMNGQRLRYRSRTKGGGRGFTCDLLVLDEAMDLPEATLGAVIPTLSSRPKPQIWYAGSAVDQTVHENGMALSRLRQKAIDREPRIAYFEWSLDADDPAKVPVEVARDPEAWAVVNPALDIRITPEYIADERGSLDSRTFNVERLGVGDWPAPNDDGAVISVAQWNDLIDAQSKLADPVAFAFDVAPDRSCASVSAAGRRADGNYHVETVQRGAGTGWVVDRLVELLASHPNVGIFYDGYSPSGSMLHELEEKGVEAVSVTAKEHAQACGLIYDMVDQKRIRHLGTRDLLDALRGAARRPYGDAWAWSRKSSTVDISPLVGATLALWGITVAQPPQPAGPMVSWR